MGIRRINQWRYKEALGYLQNAAEKLNYLYYQPKEGELYYYLGLAHEGLGNENEAFNNYYRATWYYQWYSSAYYKLALVESRKGDYLKALEYTKNAHSTNNYDGGINALYCAMLRKVGREEEAIKVANKLLKYDPLNFTLRYELALIQENGSLKKWNVNMQDLENNYLEIAVNYLNAGLFEDGIKLLKQIKNVRNPLIYYYLASFYAQVDKFSESKEMIRSAKNASLDYCFPYREETEKVLEYIINKESDNADAYYLLGNLLYDRRPGEAIVAWNKAITIDENFSMAWRNLAFGACYYEDDHKKAIKYIQTAISKNNNEAIWYSELESYYDIAGIDNDECIRIMEDNIDIVRQDIEAPKKLVKLYNLKGEYDKAIKFLNAHQFRTWELAGRIHHYYVDSHCLKAIDLAVGQDYENALNHLNEALLYPENLEVGKGLDDGRNAMIFYYMGFLYDKMSDKKKANECFQKSINSINSADWKDLPYYQAKSLEKLEKKGEAKVIYKELIREGEITLINAKKRSGISVEVNAQNNRMVSNAYYIMGLGLKGIGKEDEARDIFEKSISVYRSNLWAKYQLEKVNFD